MAGKSEAVLVVVKSDPSDMGGNIWKKKVREIEEKM